MLADRYELGEQLGVGGMARVVRAHDTLLDRPVAVKLLHDAPDDAARQRFLREARSSARLRHPSAVAVYDTGEDAHQPYIVMELVEGRSLADLLRDRGSLDVEEAIGITASVLDALGAAHAAGIIHRDVKPANVLLPDEGGVKLSDFGIAKAMDDAAEGLTATGSVLGTPSYLAPELIEGAQASPASDLYSVGCLLYAQLAGHPPFRGAPLTVAYAHRHEPVPPIEAERFDLPDDLLAVLSRALDKDPERRFSDAAAMRAALLGGPMGEPTDGEPTVAMAAPLTAGPDTGRTGTGSTGGTGAGDTGVGGPSETTRVVHDGSPSDEHAGATRVMGATDAAAADAVEDRGRGRAILVALIVLLAIALVLWVVLDRDGTDDLDRNDDVVEDPDGSPDDPADEPPADETPGDEAPDDTSEDAPADAPDDDPGDAPADEPDTDDPGTDDSPPDDPADTDPPDDTEAPTDDDGDDTAPPPGQDEPGDGPPDETPGQGTPGGGATDASGQGGGTPPGQQAAAPR